MATLYFNAELIPFGPGPQPSAFVVEAGRFVYVGEAETAAARWPGITKVDMAGRTVSPGFNDCHCHILMFGQRLMHAQLSPPAVRSIDDLLAALSRWAADRPDSPWIVGSGYDQNRMDDRRHPTRHELDTVSSERPVLAVHTSGHALSVNSVALRLAGIGRDTDPPTGGEIGRDETGEPNGVLFETAMGLVYDVVPESSPLDKVEAIKRAAAAMAAMGITSACDASTDAREEPGLYAAAAEQGARLRMTLMPLYETIWDGIRIPTVEQFNPLPAGGNVRIGPVKLFSDGALTTRTAALRLRYEDVDTRGLLTYEPTELHRLIEQIHRSGRQAAIHAIGDLAIETVLEGYEKAQAAHPRADARHRVEHAMLLTADLRQRMARLGAPAIMQPEFVWRLGDAYVKGLGGERAAGLNPAVSCANDGVKVAFSSDLPVVPGAPLHGMRAAMDRRTATGTVLGADQAVDATAALECYTTAAAYSTFDETETGRIAEGYLADFVVLSRNPLTTPLEEWETVDVVATVNRGERSYGDWPG